MAETKIRRRRITKPIRRRPITGETTQKDDGEYDLLDPNYFDMDAFARSVSGQLKLTETVLRSMFNYILRGTPMDVACEMCCISDSTHSVWRRKGRTYIEALENGEEPIPDDKIYAIYYRATSTARAAFLHKIAKRVCDSDWSPSWVRDITILERRDPRNWGRSMTLFGDEGSDGFDPDESFL